MATSRPNEVPETRASRRGRRWFWRVVAILFLLILIAPVAIWKIIVYNADRSYAAAQAEADRLDPGWRWPDLEARRQVVPDNENSARIVMDIQSRGLIPASWGMQPKADFEPSPVDESAVGFNPRDCELLPMPDEFFEEYPDSVYVRIRNLPLGARCDEFLLRGLARELARAKDALQVAMKLTEMPHGRYPLRLSADFIPDVSYIHGARQVAQILQFESYRRSQSADMAGAVQCIRALLNDARSIGDEPFLISQLVRIAIVAITVSSLENALAQGEAPVQQLAELQDALVVEAAFPRLLTATRGERHTQMAIIDDVINGKVGVSQLNSPFSAPKPSNRVEDFFGRMDTLRARPEMFERVTEYVEILKQPCNEWLGKTAEMEQRCNTGPEWMRSFGPAMSKMFEAELRCIAFCRSAAGAMAAERFRLQFGRWPNSWDDIVREGILSAVPSDPYTGQTLKMIPRDHTFVIYTLGKDLTDRAGIIDRSEQEYKRGYGQGFRLLHRDCRHVQPEKLPMPKEDPGEFWINPPPANSDTSK